MCSNIVSGVKKYFKTKRNRNRMDAYVSDVNLIAAFQN